MAKDLELFLTTNPIATWIFRNVASRLDPILYRATNGRYFSMGAPTMPMVTITMRGRKTGKPRAVHLAAVPDGEHHLVVASAMGQEKHPGWRYNLEASPECEIQLPGERFIARAEVLTDLEKAKVWDEVRRLIPQMTVYEKRTDRNIRVFRLVRV